MNKNIRELKGKLSLTEDITEKVTLCNHIADAYVEHDIEQAIFYGQKAFEFSKTLDNDALLAETYVKLGIIELTQENIKLGVEYYYKAFQITEDPYIKARILMGIGLIYSEIFIFETAIAYEEKALELAIELKAAKLISIIYNNLGHMYYCLEQYDTAISYYELGIDIAEKEGNTKNLTYFQVGLTRTMLSKGNLDLTEKSILKIDELVESQKEMWYLGVVQGLWACYYVATGSLDTAKERFNTCQEILLDEKQFYYLTIAYRFYAKFLIQYNYNYEANLILKEYKLLLDQHDLKITYTKYLMIKSKNCLAQNDVKQYSYFKKKFDESKLENLQFIESYFKPEK